MGIVTLVLLGGAFAFPWRFWRCVAQMTLGILFFRYRRKIKCRCMIYFSAISGKITLLAVLGNA